jgi:hypothetical protein
MRAAKRAVGPSRATGTAGVLAAVSSSGWIALSRHLHDLGDTPVAMVVVPGATMAGIQVRRSPAGRAETAAARAPLSRMMMLCRYRARMAQDRGENRAPTGHEGGHDRRVRDPRAGSRAGRGRGACRQSRDRGGQGAAEQDDDAVPVPGADAHRRGPSPRSPRPPECSPPSRPRAGSPCRGTCTIWATPPSPWSSKEHGLKIP